MTQNDERQAQPNPEPQGLREVQLFAAVVSVNPLCQLPLPGRRLAIGLVAFSLGLVCADKALSFACNQLLSLFLSVAACYVSLFLCEACLLVVRCTGCIGDALIS
jgi:hypothetical protein